MRATKQMTKSTKRPLRKRPGQALAERVLRLEAHEVDLFVDALLPGADAEFREDLSDIIVSEQRKDEPVRPLSDFLAEAPRRGRARA